MAYPEGHLKVSRHRLDLGLEREGRSLPLRSGNGCRGCLLVLSHFRRLGVNEIEKNQSFWRTHFYWRHAEIVPLTWNTLENDPYGVGIAMKAFRSFLNEIGSNSP
jgi:hypothetical protein